jgi:hypothetical protein
MIFFRIKLKKTHKKDKSKIFKTRISLSLSITHSFLFKFFLHFTGYSIIRRVLFCSLHFYFLSLFCSFYKNKNGFVFLNYFSLKNCKTVKKINWNSFRFFYLSHINNLTIQFKTAKNTKKEYSKNVFLSFPLFFLLFVCLVF